MIALDDGQVPLATHTISIIHLSYGLESLSRNTAA